jgi:hypothetical protein
MVQSQKVRDVTEHFGACVLKQLLQCQAATSGKVIHKDEFGVNAIQKLLSVVDKGSSIACA